MSNKDDKDYNISFELTALVAAKQALKTADQGTMLCPRCEKALSFWVEGRKRHSRGRCETPGCIVWIE